MSAQADVEFLHAIADGPADREKLAGIDADRQAILRGEELDGGAGHHADTDHMSHRVLHLDGLTFVLARSTAPASLDTLVEILRDRAHMNGSGFAAQENRSLIDLGANEGIYSTVMKRDNPQLQVVALEPVPDTFGRLERTLRANGFRDVTTVNKAVTDCSGTIELDTYPHVSSIASRHLAERPIPWLKRERISPVSVESTTLPELFADLGLEHIDLLKLDVEGDELRVLEAGSSVFHRISRIVVEYHGFTVRERCITLLAQAGFRLTHGDHAGWGDLYFERSLRLGDTEAT
jgi:FkbM family methyltransferase